MSAYELLKLIHILLAIVAVGANMTYGVWITLAAREPRHLAFALKGVKVLDDRIANPCYLLLLLTGLAMIHLGTLSWTTPWLMVSLFLYACVVVLGLLGYTPVLRRQIAVLESAGPDSAEYGVLAARARRLGIMLAVFVLAIVVLMVTKPALWR